jgi:hypothetical protein
MADRSGNTMGMEVGKEYNWQDVALRRLEPLRATDTSSTILVLGYIDAFFEEHDYGN